MKGYDGVFILHDFIENQMPKDSRDGPKVINNGTKIIGLNWRTIKIIDSFSFIPCALSNFAKTYDLKELYKGFFPHTFNTLENQLIIVSRYSQIKWKFIPSVMTNFIGTMTSALFFLMRLSK